MAERDLRTDWMILAQLLIARYGHTYAVGYLTGMLLSLSKNDFQLRRQLHNILEQEHKKENFKLMGQRRRQ